MICANMCQLERGTVVSCGGLTASDNANPSDMATLTTQAIANRTGLPLRTVQRRVASWELRGWPRVVREPRRGNPRGVVLVVEADFEALCAGECPAER